MSIVGFWDSLWRGKEAKVGKECSEELERWLREDAVKSYEEYKADPSTGIPAEEFMGRVRESYPAMKPPLHIGQGWVEHDGREYSGSHYDIVEIKLRNGDVWRDKVTAFWLLGDHTGHDCDIIAYRVWERAE